MPFTIDDIKTNPDLQDILSVNLERAVQQCVDLCSMCIAELQLPPPPTMSEGFDALAHNKFITPELALKMKKAVGFRNIALHEYEKMDWAIVHSICHKQLTDLKTFGKAISEKAGL